MSVSRTVTFHYAVQLEMVAGLLCDAVFLLLRCEDLGESAVQVTTEVLGDRYRVVISRDVEVQVPTFARRIFRARSHVVDDIKWRWEGVSWIGDYTIKIDGFPGAIRGRSILTPSGSGCAHETSFEVTATVPLIAATVERLVADRVVEGFQRHEAYTARRLGPR